MPGGHASHKGSADKPNTNAAGQIDTASKKSIDPQDVLPQDVTTNSDRVQEAVDYPPATERLSNTGVGNGEG